MRGEFGIMIRYKLIEVKDASISPNKGIFQYFCINSVHQYTLHTCTGTHMHQYTHALFTPMHYVHTCTMYTHVHQYIHAPCTPMHHVHTCTSTHMHQYTHAQYTHVPCTHMYTHAPVHMHQYTHSPVHTFTSIKLSAYLPSTDIETVDTPDDDGSVEGVKGDGEHNFIY